MLKDNAGALAILLRFIDLLIVYVSAYIAYFYSAAHEFYIVQGLPGFPSNYLVVVLAALLPTSSSVRYRVHLQLLSAFYCFRL